ncbi:MAG: hypothetical protein H0T15_04375 [Thermoleophilaceae bacterium]|nr:hypothetical protein [Thermoleophilaceae bacterium]
MKIKSTAVTAVTACGDDEEESSKSSGSTSASADAKPVAEIPKLSGKQTEVALDPSFVEALGTLKLTPAPVGDGEISKKGVASFPITSGNVTYYKPG